MSYATQNAARQILIGNVANTNNINVNTFLSNFVCPKLPPPMSCDRVVVNSKVQPVQNSWWNLINAQKTGLAAVPMDNAQTTFCIGRSGSTVALQMYYAMPTIAFPFFNSPSTKFNGSPVFWIASTAAFRNEPFSTAYNGC